MHLISELIEKPEPCDFGTGEEPKSCGWGNTPNVTAARSIPWVISRGDDALFKGGPRTDHTENNGAGTWSQSWEYDCGDGRSRELRSELVERSLNSATSRHATSVELSFR